MALPAPRVSGCRCPAGLGGIFLPGKNREIRANPKAGRAERRLCPPGWQCQRRVAQLGEGHGDSDTGTAPLPPPGHSRPGGRWGVLYCGQFVPVSSPRVYSLLGPVGPHWSQSLFPVGAAVSSLLVPVCTPYLSQSAFPVVTGPPSLLVPVCCYWFSPCSWWELHCAPYWSQSVLTGPSLPLLVPVFPPYWCCSVLTGSSLHSLFIPAPIPCGYWSALLICASLSSLLVPVRPYQSQSVFPVRLALHSSLVPVCFPYWFQSPFPAGASPGSSWLPAPVQGRYRCQSGSVTGPSPRSLPLPLWGRFWSQSLFPAYSSTSP